MSIKHSEKAGELFMQGYNCSQSVVGAFCEELGMDFETAVKLVSPLGGGMGRLREVCGAVSGMFLLTGMIFGYTEPNNLEVKGKLYERIQELAKRFKAKHNTIICRELLEGIETSDSPEPSERTAEYYQKRPCLKIIKEAAQIFEEYLIEQNIKLNDIPAKK